MTRFFAHAWWRSLPGMLAGMLASILVSALLAGLYARGGIGWILGFVLLVPWLRALDARQTLAGALLCGWAMSLAFGAAVFAWFGFAIGNYTQVGTGTGLALLLLCAPLFQPQFIVFALVRHWFARRHGKGMAALAAASAWVALEWWLPKLLGDTLGHGLYPSRLLRQGADVGGAAGLTLLLLLTNEGFACALARRGVGMVKPLALAALGPLVLALYGLVILSTQPAANPAAKPASKPASKPLRMGLIQANMVDYEGQRRQHGTYAVVRKILDTHFAMSYDAVVRQHADAVLWSETSYPTTFGNPKSAAGFELDQSILEIIHSAGVPFVFGTYDRDSAGEYNAAAFVAPGTGLMGFYRKTRLFPLTEYVPAWLDTARLRRALPWAGSWQPGNGARVFPLRLADGREIPALPLICLDDVDTSLGIAGARLGAQVILTMSNDSWFTDYPQGAQLHQAVAAFRSIETRLPQFRVTTNGYSGVIDATGSVSSPSRLGQQTLIIGEVTPRTPPRTLMVMWGNWVGPAALAWLGLLLAFSTATAVAATPWWRKYQASAAAANSASEAALASAFPLKVSVLPPAARFAAGLLRSFARISLLWMALAILQNDALRGNTLAQIRMFTGLFLIPEAAAWCVLLAFAARASIENGVLVLAQGARRIEIALCDIAALEPWRWPLPGPGVSLRLGSGQRWRYGLALANPGILAQALTQALAQAGGVAMRVPESTSTRATLYAQACLAWRQGWLNHALTRFGLVPLALALPAYYLHQHIAFGSGFGEYTSLGLKAWATGLMLWWAAWVIGVTLYAAALRALIEIGTLLTVLLWPERAIELRPWFERCGNAMLYLGLPGWLLLRISG
jgi:apolipoprotein N-acyltransferase